MTGTQITDIRITKHDMDSRPYQFGGNWVMGRDLCQLGDSFTPRTSKPKEQVKSVSQSVFCVATHNFIYEI